MCSALAHSSSTRPLLSAAAIVFFYIPLVRASQDSDRCISKYADLKEALLQANTGNRERLLYTFNPPNRRSPHHVWVYYFHNESSEWNTVLTCPSSGYLPECPEEAKSSEYNGESNSISNNYHHLVFWADSPLLINVDIPLLKILSFNFMLQYLGSGSCVQLIIPPFCESMTNVTRNEVLNFATSYLKSYSTSSQESSRDYVLQCHNKYETEYSYTWYLFGSQIIISVGSSILFVFLSWKISSLKRDDKNKNDHTKSLPHRCNCTTSDSCSTEGEDDSAKSHQKCNCTTTDSSSKDNEIDHTETNSISEGNQNYLSVVLIINTNAILFLIIDIIQFSLSTETAKGILQYSYGMLNIVLFGITLTTILIEIPIYIIYFIIWCIIMCFNRQFLKPGQHLTIKKLRQCLRITKFLNTTLTLASLMYIISRVFMIALAIVTYPFEAGFLLMAIGSWFVAVLLMMWVIIHIVAVEAQIQATIISLVPYATLVVLLGGFLLSYIYIIVKLNIQLGDPLTSLVAALVPTIIIMLVSNQYESEIEQLKAGKLKGTPPQNTPAPPQNTPEEFEMIPQSQDREVDEIPLLDSQV